MFAMPRVLWNQADQRWWPSPAALGATASAVEWSPGRPWAASTGNSEALASLPKAAAPASTRRRLFGLASAPHRRPARNRGEPRRATSLDALPPRRTNPRHPWFLHTTVARQTCTTAGAAAAAVATPPSHAAPLPRLLDVRSGSTSPRSDRIGPSRRAQGIAASKAAQLRPMLPAAEGVTRAACRAKTGSILWLPHQRRAAGPIRGPPLRGAAQKDCGVDPAR